MKSIIIYTTKYGSVEKAAKALKAKLGGEVAMVNLMKESAPSLDGFDNVILGGSIYVSKVQKQLTDYINSNMSKLLKKRVGLFICAGLPEAETREKELRGAFPAELQNHAVSKEIFGYDLDFDKMSFIDKTLMRVVKGTKESSSEFFEKNMESMAKALSAK